MDSILSTWSTGNEVKDNSAIGEFVINENNLTFHIQGYSQPFARNFVGKNDSHYYKVYTYGQGAVDSTGFFYHVDKAFSYNGDNYNEFFGDKIDGIKSFSFEIPELANWLKLKGVELRFDMDGNMGIHEKKIPWIIIKAENPKIYIKYVSNLPYSTENEIIKMTLRNSPRIFVEYEADVDDAFVIGDLQRIIRFFALLLGKISYADDIRLELTKGNSNMMLFVNQDFSHNPSSTTNHSYRTEVQKVIEELQSYFETWYSFAQNDKFTYLLNAYFHSKGKKIKNTNDLFLTYCKFLEGYDLRIANDEANANRLSDGLKTVMISEEIKTLLSPIFKEANSTYQPKKITEWISKAFLERVNLETRIKRLDERFLQVIAANTTNIVNVNHIDEFYSKIVKTRNYYSHNKLDDKGILSFEEMFRTIELLEALIVIILLSEIGMTIEVIKSFMIRDDKYWSILSHHAKE